MAYCTNCGAQIADDVKFCSSCGKPVDSSTSNTNKNANDFSQKLNNLNNTADSTFNYTQTDIESNKTLALFSYIGFLFIIPILAAPNSKFARFHANQGIVLFIIEFLYGIAVGIVTEVFKLLNLGFIGSLLNIFNLVFLVLMILGIVNAVNGRAKELPVIGNIRILK